MYEHEEIEENEGKELAKESTGVEDLFIKIGKKFINPNSSETGKNTKVDNQQKGQKLNTAKAKNDGGKKGCC